MPPSHRKTFLCFVSLAAALAVFRYFAKGLLEPLDVPVLVGSFLASVTVVLLAATAVFFLREGRAPGGRYLRAAAWFSALAAWCEVLVITGILVTEWSGADTYYRGPWRMVEDVFPDASAHALGHAQGFFVRLPIGLLLGAAAYAIAKRGRPGTGPGGEPA
jgi:hypothetical protein